MGVPKIVAMGTCCVDVYPQKSTIRAGGETLNIAAQLSRTDDIDIYLMGVVGDDDYGEVILESIKGLRINQEHLQTAAGESAHHVIQIDETGDRFFEEGAWHGGVSEQLALTGESLDLLKQADAVMVTLWQPHLEQLVELKKEYGFLLAVDFNEQRDFSAWESLMSDIDIVFSSGTESMEDEFLARSKKSDNIFVLTYGDKGSAAFQAGNRFKCDAVEVNDVVDTTGCGDCYQGYFVLEYLTTKNIEKAMKRGALEAAKVTQYVGGIPK